MSAKQAETKIGKYPFTKLSNGKYECVVCGATYPDKAIAERHSCMGKDAIRGPFAPLCSCKKCPVCGENIRHKQKVKLQGVK